MHVCLITSGRPSEVLYGGEEKSTISLRNWLLEHGQNVTIVGRKLFGVKVIESDNPSSIRPSTNVRTLPLPYPIGMVCMLLTSLLFTLHILLINHRSRISVVHAQDTGYGGLSAIMSAKILGVPVVLSSHGVRHATLTKALKGTLMGSLSLIFERWLDILTSRRADLVTVVASTHKHVFTNLGVQITKITFIPVGINVSNFRLNGEVRKAVRRELDVQDDTLMGFIGRFSAEKNLSTLLESFAQALKDTNKMKLALTGTGARALEDRLRTFCRFRGIDDKVIFTGVRYDVDRLLSALDVFLLPSYEEGCPTALLEAMASGKAIISSKIPSIREILRHGKEAILVDPHNVEELKQAILLLHNSADLRVKFGHNAKERAKFYDIDRICWQILTMYKELIDNQ